MSKVIDEHFVPQSYLSKFAFDGKYLYVFDKSTKHTFYANIKNLACERYFYDLPGDDSQTVENKLGELIDGNYPTWIDELLATVNNGHDIDQHQKENLALCMTNQLLRTRKYRDFHQEIVEETFSTMLQMTLAAKAKFGGLKLDKPLDAYRVKYNQKMAPVDQARSMFGPVIFRIVDILCSHIWVVGKNTTEKPLYTSDNPVVWDTHKEYPPNRGFGLASEGIEVVFPLTPKYVIALLERKFFQEYKELDCKCIDLDSEGIKYYNGFQVFHSYRQIYCPTNDFNQAEDICNQYPQVCLHKK